VSSALSIFQKLCPTCTSSIPVDAERCDCGYVFESEGNNDASPVENALRDEELYETYLAARTAQAHEAVRAAEDALAEEPDSAERRSAVELAREVAGSIDADLAEQRNKIAALRKVVSSMKSSRPKAPVTKPAQSAVTATAATQPAPKPGKKQNPEKPAVTVRAQPETRPAAKSPPQIVQPAVQIPVAKTKAATPASDPRVSISSLVASVAATAHKAAGALEAIKKAKALEAPAQAASPVAAPVPPAQPSPQTPVVATVAAPAPAVTPPAAFRAEQAARAEKAMEAHKKPADAKECPNCTASVPTAATRCRCGFVFAAGSNDLPSLTLCTGDFTALRNNFLNNLRRN
jgi:ribosomal protein L40E